MSRCQQLDLTGRACNACIEKAHRVNRIMDRTVEWHDDVDADLEGLTQWHSDMLLDAGPEPAPTGWFDPHKGDTYW